MLSVSDVPESESAAKSAVTSVVVSMGATDEESARSAVTSVVVSMGETDTVGITLVGVVVAEGEVVLGDESGTASAPYELEFLSPCSLFSSAYSLLYLLSLALSLFCVSATSTLSLLSSVFDCKNCAVPPSEVSAPSSPAAVSSSSASSSSSSASANRSAIELSSSNNASIESPSVTVSSAENSSEVSD